MAERGRRRREQGFAASGVLSLRAATLRQQRQQTILGAVAGLLALAAGLLYVLVQPTTLLLPILLLTVTLLPAVFWYFPRLSLYGILSAACLFEIFKQIEDGSGITDAVPFFWNINTMFEKCLGSNPHAVPINYFELVLIIFSAVMLLRFATRQQTTMRCGSLFWPILVYLGFVAVGWLNGMTTGGNFNEALQEVRAQLYFGVAYFLAVNAVRNEKHAAPLIWLTVLCIGFKACNYIWRHFTIFHGEIQEQGVGSHEEAFFFMAFVMLLATLSFSRLLPKLQMLMWALLPLIIFANLTTNRRTAYAAVTIVLPVLLLAAYQGFPKARKGVLSFIVVLAAVFPPYFLAFRNSSGALGGPARAIQSAIAPSQRDSDSDQYRKIENYDLMLTVRATSTTQLIGYGYGKRFLTPGGNLDMIKDIYPWYNLLPHNQILWVWMRLGTLGFLAFWGMVCATLVYACRVIRYKESEAKRKAASESNLYPRAVALYTLILVVLLLVFGLLDLQLSNFRDMIFVAIWVGAMSGLAPNALSLNDPEKRRRRPGVHERPTRQERPRRQPRRMS